jgi:two-component system, OmpR family, copper resistance phosphate regulon response regulator CusR
MSSLIKHGIRLYLYTRYKVYLYKEFRAASRLFGYSRCLVKLPSSATEVGFTYFYTASQKYWIREIWPMNILVVEDEQKVAAFLKNGLGEHGYAVDLAYDGYTGEKLALSKPYDLILLDVVIPVVNGIDLCKKIKSAKPELPILMLTALGTTDDKVSGFDSGADDYLVKPFEFKELLARIRALTKRTSPKPIIDHLSNVLIVGDLKLDIDKKVAVRQDKTISLTAKEFALLEYMMRNKGRVVSKVDIAEHVWDITFDTGTNVVEVYVNLIRKKIDKDFSVKLIQTRIGLGYVIQEP